MIWCLLCFLSRADAPSVPHSSVLWYWVQSFQTFTLLQRRMSRKSRCLFFWILSSSFSSESNIFLSCITWSAQKRDQFGASCPSRVPSRAWPLGHQLGLCLMCNPLANPCCNPALSHSGDKWGRGSAGGQDWGERGRNTCVGMGQLAGILKLTAFASQVVEDIFEGKSLDSIVHEVAQVINSSNIIVGVAVRRPRLKLVLAKRVVKGALALPGFGNSGTDLWVWQLELKLKAHFMMLSSVIKLTSWKSSTDFFSMILLSHLS